MNDKERYLQAIKADNGRLEDIVLGESLNMLAKSRFLLANGWCSVVFLDQLVSVCL